MALPLRLHLGANGHCAEPALVRPNPTFASTVVQRSRASRMSYLDTYHHAMDICAELPIFVHPAEFAIQWHRRDQRMVLSEVHQHRLVHDGLSKYFDRRAIVYSVWNGNSLLHLNELLRN
jgi:hypothetical protein